MLYQTRLRRRRQSDPLMFNHALAQPQGTPKWLPAKNVGDVSGRDPTEPSQLREGTFFPSLLEPKKRSEKALLAVVHPSQVLNGVTSLVCTLCETSWPMSPR